MKIGYAQAVITPRIDPHRPAFLAGFERNRRAKAVHDDLWVRALALVQPGVGGAEPTCLVLAALDLIGFGRQRCLAVEARLQNACQALGLPVAQLLLACTHVHHAPDTIGFWGPDELTSGVDPDYLAFVEQQCLETSLKALQNLQPAAALRAAAVEVPGVAKNQRDPGIVDIELTCLQFSGAGGPLASVMIFPCHPEGVDPEGTTITSDYPHFLRAAVEAATGAPCLFFSGALGGMMSPDLPERSFAATERMGEQLAAAGLQALAGAESFEPWVRVRRRIFTTRLANPLFQAAVQVGLLPDTANAAGEITTETNLVQLGPAWLVSVPGELLPKLGLEIKALLGRSGPCRFPAVIGLANDELGYILPEAEYIYPDDPLDPQGHYEETMSVGAEIGTQLVQNVRAMLEVGT